MDTKHKTYLNLIPEGYERDVCGKPAKESTFLNYLYKVVLQVSKQRLERK